jgi:hypothetical protein
MLDYSVTSGTGLSLMLECQCRSDKDAGLTFFQYSGFPAFRHFSISAFI